MENEFAKVMSERTDEELIKIVTVERESYNPTAIEAADAEIEKRNIDTSEFEKIKEQATVEKEQIQKVDSNVVGSGIRFVNFLIDFIVWLILAFIVSFIIGIFVQPTDQGLLTLFGYVLIFGTFIAYYAIMEIKFQKTIGKFVTKTKVVKMNGEKPTDGDIITRTFCRLIPFDRLSFLFVKNGIHDFLSKTKVVKDTTE
ncbi:RDD family protein [Aequorivita sinensis]|uniref:RDD family protein n=1 Tax=Aequorivita sinensis TaxID=1382458 RepID=UPI001122A87C|nr:RDD family protein [Aequorivita sinensis]